MLKLILISHKELIKMKKAWWKEAVVYQIYPISFKDSNNDGYGDLNGIMQKLDYLCDLGIDVVWLNPVYKSPNDDNGYDISDYRDIMKEFGTMEDWEKLLAAMHSKGIKLIMDLVVNHTSDEHPWFIESRKSKDNPYRDYYIWKEGKNGFEPNNWKSHFEGSAWELDEKTGEYYLHLFSKKQPDLNWENEKVREEVFDIVKFWLDKGIDGFRMDVINMISKVEGLPSIGNDASSYVDGGKYFRNGPKVHEYIREMNEKVLSKYDIMTVGETPGVTPEDGLKYAGEDRHELSMIFQFEHVDIDVGPEGPAVIKDWKLTDLKKVMDKWQVELYEKGWNSLYLNNHDQPRMVSRFGDDGKYRVESAKMLGTFLHTLQGTPYIYQGEEIGMTNVHFPSIEDYRDISTVNAYKVAVSMGFPVEMIMPVVHYRSRDNARTPMQWDSSRNAGFSDADTWIKINPNYKEINVADAIEDENSIFHHYKKLISFRKNHPVVVYGKYTPLIPEDEKVYSYLRTGENEELLVILNFSSMNVPVSVPEYTLNKFSDLVISNYGYDKNPGNMEDLKPYEARVYLRKI